MKLYIPKLKDCIRLTAPLYVSKDARRPWNNGHATVAHQIAHPGERWNWSQSQALTGFLLVEGTVLQFKRYFISAHAQEDRVTVCIFAHPDRRLTPKKNGGLGNMSDLTFDLSLDVLNNIEFEKVEI